MSSSNISHFDKHKNVVGHLGTKNDEHSKISNHGRMNNHSTVHSIKDSKKHTHTSKHADDATKHREVTNTYGKITAYTHSDTRNISKKANNHKQRMGKHDTIEQDKTDSNKTDHSEIDHAVFISISTAAEDTAPNNPDAVDPDHS